VEQREASARVLNEPRKPSVSSDDFKCGNDYEEGCREHGRLSRAMFGVGKNGEVRSHARAHPAEDGDSKE